jgi:hypothetical protein
MSKLARALTLVTMLAAMSLAGMAAVAHAYPADPGTGRPTTAQQQQSTGDATLKRTLARERSSIPSLAPVQVTSPVRPAEPGGHAGRLIPALGVLAAVLALAGVAVVARRATRSQRDAKPA